MPHERDNQVKTLKEVADEIGRTYGEVCDMFIKLRCRRTIRRFWWGEQPAEEHGWWCFSHAGQEHVSAAAANLIEDELNMDRSITK
jgi:hypothetical protein